MKSKVTEMFGIKYPIICGAMMWLCEHQLCSAVSNAGGMGNLTAGNYENEDDFRNAINKTRELTDKPFMVNVTIFPSVRITEEHHKMYLRVCAEEKIAGLEISGAPLDKAYGLEYIDMLKKAGVKLFQKVASVKHAIHAEKVGYDGIYAIGHEGGGHPLDVTTMLLTARAVESVSIPVVTAGGISNGRTMAAALSLGAEGIMMASRFMATRECIIHNNIKQELVKRQENETVLFLKSFGMQGRALKNAVVEKIIALEEKNCKIEDIFPLVSGEKMRKAWETGDVEGSPMMVGQSIGLINDIPTCKKLIERMVKEAGEHISNASDKFDGGLKNEKD